MSEEISISVIDKNVRSSDGVHTLAGKVYIPELPENEIVGCFHVVHGMKEHIARYDKFMREMAELGYVVFGYDNLGHGNTADNDGELGFIAEKDGYKYLARDVKVFSDAVFSQFGRRKYILMGHSMGSFIVRYACAGYVKPDKLIIMGTGGKNPAAPLGLMLIDILKKTKGPRYISKTVDDMAFGKFNSRTGEDDDLSWLTKDKEVREKYRGDKFCTFEFTVSAMGDLIRLNHDVNCGEWFGKLDKKMPILLVSGEDDPVGDWGRGVEQVYRRLKKAGCSAEMKLYKNCRHEILNDDSYPEVAADIESFIAE